MSKDELTVAPTGEKGRGVLAGRLFDEGDLVEICPVIELSVEDFSSLNATVMGNYTFDWPPDNGGAVLMGYGMLYNHSDDPNMRLGRDHENRLARFYATRRIEMGEELTFGYNVVWFKKEEGDG
jgi:hypothetical protein